MTRLTRKGLIIPKIPTSNPNLLLDFANSRTLDPKVSFARNSKATRVNSSGLVEEVGSDQPRFDFDPASLRCKGLLIEEARTNLITNSTNFSAPSWFTVKSSIIPNCATAPDGSFTATKLLDSTETSTHCIQGSMPTSAYLDKTLIFSVFLKAGGANFAYIETGNYGNWVNPFMLRVNLVTGEMRTHLETQDQIDRSRIEKFPNGWWRVSVAGTTVNTDPPGNLAPRIGIGESLSNVEYSGDGKTGIYIWGAQLEVGPYPTSVSPTTYIPTVETFTSRASTATYIDSTGKIATAAINAPRYSYNPENLNVPPKLLLEGAKTNLLQYSEDVSNSWWEKVRGTVSNGTPSPIAGVNGMKVTPTAVVGNHTIARSLTLTNAGVYTFSFFAKSAGYNFARLRIGLNSNFLGAFLVNLATGEMWGAGDATILDKRITRYPDGWVRVSGSFESPASAAVDVSCWVYEAGGTNGEFVGDGTSGIEVTGFQLEEGYLSSYIPTTSAPVTRSADVYTSTTATRLADLASITGTNFSSWFNNKDGGTFIINGQSYMPNYMPIANERRHLFTLWSNSVPGALEYLYFDSGGLRSVTRMNLNSPLYTRQTYPFDPKNESEMRTVVSFKPGGHVASVNGGISYSDTIALAITNYDSLYFGTQGTGAVRMLNGHISKLAYYPKQLTDEELQALSE